MERKRDTGLLENAAAMQAMTNLFSNIFWTCTRVIKPPYKTADVTPEEMTAYQNCVQKHIDFMQGPKGGVNPNGI